jgi:polar amino acid transport system substrate-binding protein
MRTITSHRRTSLLVASLIASVALTACSNASEEEAKNTDSHGLNLGPDQHRIVPSKVDSIAAKVPDAIGKDGVLTVGVGGGSTGYPPLGMTATDNKTLIGYLPDEITLVAGILGLKPEILNTSFENLSIGVDSGKYEVADSNITVTKTRLEKYDFATDRTDGNYFEVKKGSKLKINAPEDAEGLSIGVTPGGLQDKTMLDWNQQLGAKGLKQIDIKYMSDTAGAELALQSGSIDAYLTNSASVSYRTSLPDAKVAVGGSTLIGAGDVGWMSSKGNGMAAVIAEAFNYLIQSGDYDKVIARWNLDGTGITQSVVNPPGLDL